MPTASTRTTPENLTESFSQLKRTARRRDDIVNWLQAHPALIPNLPETLYAHLQVSEVAMQWEFDAFDRIVGHIVTLRCIVASQPDGLATSALAALTGWDLAGQDPKHVFDLNLKVNLSMHEWPFVAAFELYGKRQNYDRVRYYARPLEEILAACFPALTMDAFNQLVAADLLPTELHAFTDWLYTHRHGHAPTVIEIPDMAGPSEAI